MKGLHFNVPESVDGWGAIDDRVMGGVSCSRLCLHPDGHAVFEGEVSTKNGGGFASVRHEQLRLGDRGAEGYRLLVRGDGKRYKLNLRTDGGLDGIQYQAAFQPPAEQWVDVVLPLNLFMPRFRGRPVPNVPPLHPERVCQVGWMVGDGQTGPFRLDIRSVVALGSCPTGAAG
jgi:NADH dehydrogenase [ubiquinone] 1 alpha subcomplex assembly factor 1